MTANKALQQTLDPATPAAGAKQRQHQVQLSLGVRPHTRMRFNIFILILACCLISSCGTMLGGSHQTIKISTEPSGATVLIEPHGISATTPAEVSLARSIDHVAVFSLDGFEPKRVRINRSIAQSAVAGSIVPYLGALSMATDSATDGEFRLDPDSIHVILEPSTTGQVNSDGENAATSRPVKFFNRNSLYGAVYLEIDNGQKCKLKKGKFVTIDLPMGTHSMIVYHWDIIKFKNEYELMIDNSISHVGIFSAITSTQYSYYDEFPNLKRGFEEVACAMDGAT